MREELSVQDQESKPNLPIVIRMVFICLTAFVVVAVFGDALDYAIQAYTTLKPYWIR